MYKTSTRKIAIAGLTLIALTFAQTGSASVLLTEGFDNITTLSGSGWVQVNHSNPLGSTNWFQGNGAVFPSQAGASNSYIAANWQNTSGSGTISDWLITPAMTLDPTAQLTFYTRTTTGTFPDRLQVRLSINGASSDVGTTATDVGDFTTLLLDINPTLNTTGYPVAWTSYTVTLSSLGGPTLGRLAFRYFVTDGGPSGLNSDYIGIDSVQVDGAAVPEPSTMLLTGLGGLSMLSVARRLRK